VINPNQIIRRADHDEVDSSTVERDYVLTHVLCAIALDAEAPRMVFKGGTALRLCFFDDYRYSADLDFSLLDGLTPPVAREAVERALASVRETIGLLQLELDRNTPPRIVYTGPLGGERSIKLDLADDELVVEHDEAEVLVRYPDQPEGLSKRTYTLDEIGAEKLRCLIQRQQCRDLFDLHALFEDKDIQPSEIWPTFERKARHRRIDPEIFPERFEARMKAYSRLWDTEMEQHVAGEPPPFNAVERAVRRYLRPWLMR